MNTLNLKKSFVDFLHSSCYIKKGIFYCSTFVGSAWSFVFFSSPPQRSMTSDFEGFSIPDFIHYLYFPILILEIEPVFPFLMFSFKQGNYWYHFYNVFGVTGD